MATSNRIDRRFADLRAAGRTAFMPFLTAGDPDLETTARLIPALEAAGADLVELGIPFSDSIADGPTIQLANQRSLEGGTSVRGVLETVRTVRRTSEIPILLMGSFNPLVVYGVERFCTDAAAAGADGLIIADCPPDSASDLLEPAREHGLATVFLAAPTSSPERLELVARTTTGFLYAVSLTGVTGEREALPEELGEFVRTLKGPTETPVCVGFGISSPEMAREVARDADGVIVGSAIVKRIAAAAREGTDPCEAVASFVRAIREALDA
jgi:tryptophan synthase alpha chain